jgi:hypothetical protein
MSARYPLEKSPLNVLHETRGRGISVQEQEELAAQTLSRTVYPKISIENARQIVKIGYPSIPLNEAKSRLAQKKASTSGGRRKKTHRKHKKHARRTRRHR